MDVHCIGGFVVSQIHGLGRATSDLDLAEVIPREQIAEIERLAGRESDLARTHRVHVQFVGVASLPDSYASRLVRVHPSLRRLRLWALEAHDLALSKHVIHLARSGLIQEDKLVKRYETELRPYLSGRTPSCNDATMRMWVEACWPR